MAASISAKTVTSTGTLQGGRTRLKSFYVKTAGSGSPAWWSNTVIYGLSSK